jgi:hypothetical protein
VRLLFGLIEILDAKPNPNLEYWLPPRIKNAFGALQFSFLKMHPECNVMSCQQKNEIKLYEIFPRS